MKRKDGDIVKIKLKNGKFCFARVLKEPLMAFYDKIWDNTPELREILESKVLFKVWVMENAITSGRWPVIGSADIEKYLDKPVEFFKIDPISKKYFIYINGEETASTKEECEGLERAAVWEPEHVEDRLMDYHDGLPNKWVKSLRA